MKKTINSMKISPKNSIEITNLYLDDTAFENFLYVILQYDLHPSILPMLINALLLEISISHGIATESAFDKKLAFDDFMCILQGIFKHVQLNTIAPDGFATLEPSTAVNH